MERTNRFYIETLLKNNPLWNVLDIGCGKHPITKAATALDVQDLTDYYKNSEVNFICGDACSTPFSDKEFDFVFASHIAEHVSDPNRFCNELMRISKKGYIEIPNPLFDNLFMSNHIGHLWWVTFDDIQKSLRFSPKIGVLKEVLQVEEYNILLAFFRESMVTEIYWEDKINFQVQDKFIPYHSIDDNQKINIVSSLDNNTYEMPTWKLGDKSKLGLREKAAHRINLIIRKVLLLDV
jgi:SAM-dependent methyltransferase